MLVAIFYPIVTSRCVKPKRPSTSGFVESLLPFCPWRTKATGASSRLWIALQGAGVIHRTSRGTHHKSTAACRVVTDDLGSGLPSLRGDGGRTRWALPDSACVPVEGGI